MTDALKAAAEVERIKALMDIVEKKYPDGKSQAKAYAFIDGFNSGAKYQREVDAGIATTFDTKGVPDHQIKLRIAQAIREGRSG